ncbi:MAG: polysaccharide biosynthesis C-terminal domain-containing protein, partial [Bacteroidota bacterium]
MWLAPRRNVSNVAGLQVFNTLRFVVFLVIAIVFTKIGLSKEQIGTFEISVFMVNIASFFWVTGIIQAFLPLYKGSKTFGDLANEKKNKSPEIFNTYLVLISFSLLVFFIGLIIQSNFSVFGIKGKAPLLNVTLWLLLLSSPANLVEYIYVVKNKSGNTLSYAYITYGIQLAAAIIPPILGYDVIWSLRGLVMVAIIRNIWLITLIYNYAKVKFSFPFIKELLSIAAPLLITALISGSAQYIDGLVVSIHFDASKFAVFRYGAKELPFVIMLATGLSNAMLTEFSSKENIRDSLQKIKKKSLRIMHSMFPLSIVLLLFADPLYKLMFSPEFTRSADIFVVYLLTILSRLLFPHTILMGLKKTRAVLIVAVIEVILNVSLSFWLVNHYGAVGVALATIIAYFVAKVILVIYNYVRMNISPFEYIPVKWYVGYGVALGAIFILLDR